MNLINGNFGQFLSKIFSIFSQVLNYFICIFDSLFQNNFIKFSLYLGIFIFVIDISFYLFGIVKDIIFYYRSDEDAELKNFEKDLRYERMKIIKSRQKFQKSYKPKMVEVYEYDWLDNEDDEI